MSSNSIFSQMDIVKIIRSYGINLIREGNRYYGSIPPVGQTGKSLHVWADTNTWFCNKNHVGGGIIDFIQNREIGFTKRQALEKAVEISGVQLELLSDEQIDKLAEKAEVYKTLTAATSAYNANLTTDLYSFIFNKWGITRESADEWNLGYASTERNLDGIDPKILIKTGLVNITDTGNMGGEFYRGRIIFPHIINGITQYMAGSATPDTPDHDKESKYKYLRIRSETKNEQISEFIQKKGFFGEDRLKNADVCFITEGLADCIVANQFGFPCLALGSTGISKECQEHLIHLLGKKKCVYLCFDNDENKTGQKGAITIGQILFDANIPIKIMGLPWGSKKMDIAEFMKDKEAKDFELLKKRLLAL